MTGVEVSRIQSTNLRDTIVSKLFGSHVLPKKYKQWLQFEMGVLCVLMLAVWGLLALPVIFYYHPLPVEGEETAENFSSMTVMRIMNRSSLFLSNDTLEVGLDCREDFFRDEQFNFACVPVCPDWQSKSNTATIIIDIVVVLSYSTGFFTAIAIVIISLFRRKTMFDFPNSLVVYMSIVYIFQNFFYIVTFFDRDGLYCSSRNLYITFDNVQPFCVISGMVQAYSTLSVALWWFMLTAALFWKIGFPLHAKRLQVKHRVKYIHISCGLAGLLIPFIPVIAHMANYAKEVQTDPTTDFVAGGLGFSMIQFPPLPCNGRNLDITFYTNIFPADILLAMGITLILLLFWLVHRQQIFHKANQLQHPFSFGVAERKLLILFIHFVISTVINLSTFSDFAGNAELFQGEFRRYLMCELPGHDPLNPCDRSRFERYISEPFIALSYGFHGTLPLANLIFTVSIEDLRQKWEVLRGKIKNLTTTKTASTVEMSEH